MTEQEWLTCNDPAEMLRFFNNLTFKGTDHPVISDRKLRLFAVACCRQVWDGTKCERCNGTGYDYPLNPIQQRGCPDCHGTGRIGGLTDERSCRAAAVAERFADGEATREDFLRASMEATLARQHSPFCPWNEQTPDQNKDMAALAVCNLFQESAYNAAFETGRLTRFDRTGQAALLRDIVGNPWRPVTLPDSLPRHRCQSCGHTMRMTANHRHGLGLWHCSNDSEHVTRAVTLEEMRLHKKGGCLWLTPTVVALAQAIYAERAFDRMPILADALEDAECGDEDVLRHCRGQERCNNCIPPEGEAWGIVVGSGPVICKLCNGTGWITIRGPHARGCWVVDLILGK